MIDGMLVANALELYYAGIMTAEVEDKGLLASEDRGWMASDGYIVRV